jgi:hypothetical protein
VFTDDVASFRNCVVVTPRKERRSQPSDLILELYRSSIESQSNCAADLEGGIRSKEELTNSTVNLMIALLAANPSTP